MKQIFKFHKFFHNFNDCVTTGTHQGVQLCLFTWPDDFDRFLYWDLEIPSMPIPAVSSLNLFFALCLGQSPLIPHLCPLVSFSFTLILPNMYSYICLVSILRHGDMVPNGISNLGNPMLFL